MTDNLENHMVISRANDTSDPQNAREPSRWECTCGQDHGYDVKRLGGYPKWRDNGRRFVEDCASGEDSHRCCHDCAVTCRICGCHYCPEHQKDFSQELDLCEDCGAYYVTFAPAMQGDESVEKLIRIEERLSRGRAYSRTAPLDSEVDWLILSLKEAWETIAEAQKKANR